jgi:hypothetical protein
MVSVVLLRVKQITLHSVMMWVTVHVSPLAVIVSINTFTQQQAEGRRTMVRESYTTVDNKWHSSGAPAPPASDSFALLPALGLFRIHLDLGPSSL